MLDNHNLPNNQFMESAETSIVSSKKRKLLGKGAIVLVAGGVSNVSWFTAMGLNRTLEASGNSTAWPAIGYGIGTTAVEYAMASFATSGDVDASWNPKSRVGKSIKKVSSKLPLAVTAWRGAASGAVLDQVSGREVTPKRKLAHAAVYGTVLAGWVSKPGSYALDNVLDGAQALIEKPAVGVSVVGAAAIGLYAIFHSTEENLSQVNSHSEIISSLNTPNEKP